MVQAAPQRQRSLPIQGLAGQGLILARHVCVGMQVAGKPGEQTGKGVTMFLTKFWFKADAVVSAESKADAWRLVAELASHNAEGYSTLGGFVSGGMSIEQNGKHLIEPAAMTGPAEEALVTLYHKKVIEQGERLALEEVPDPVYSMMIGFAIAQHLVAEDAKKLAQRLYRGHKEEGDQQAKG